MPGTILVSVIELLGLPSSSTLPIKVSMGKKEYQTWDKGEFSFPLTTLHETLVVVVQDEDGNAISCAGIETKSIVERGVWDDIFSLEGGGQVHMKLQFVLSEDDKNRIRVLRESAVKKNRRELLGRRTSSASSLSVYNAGKNDENASTLSPLTRRAEVNTSKVNHGELDEKVQAQSLSAQTPITEVIYPKESSSPTRVFESAPSSMTRKDQVNANKVNPGESDEKFLARSLSTETPTEAIDSKASSSSTSISELASSSKKRVSPLTQSTEVNRNEVNTGESDEKVQVQSLSVGSPNEAAYSKVSSSSTSHSEPVSSSKNRASPLIENAKVNTSKVNHEESDEKVQAQSLSGETPTETAYSKVSSSSTSSSESESSSKKQASLSTQKPEVNTSKVNLTESVEKTQTQSLISKTPTKAAYSKALSPSTSSSDLTLFSKKQVSALPQRAKVNTNKVNHGESDKKVQARSLSAGPPTEAAYSKISSPSTSSSESESSSKKQASILTQKPEVNTSKVNYGESVKKVLVQPTKASFPKESSSLKKRASLERTPSSVKRMISAFENNLSPDFRPQAKPSPVKREPNKVETELKTQASMKFKELITTKSEERESNLSPNSQHKLEKKEPDKVKDEPEKDGDKSSDDFTIKLTTEESSSAEKSSENTGISEEDSGDISVVDKEIQSENLSRSRRSSMDDQEDIHSSVEISGAWISPDHHHGRFCVTTGGKKVMDFMEGQSVKRFSIPQKDLDEDEIDRSDEAFEEEKSQPEIEYVESSRGVIQQVMKVAIMVGFGVLVLFTRQRNKR